MATSIDKKIVEMQFNNSQFESNVNQSISSINNLKNSLNFNGVGDSAESSLAGIGTAVGTVSSGFSALSVAAVSAIATISSSITSELVTAINSLSVDQILAGWTKYESITKNVGTIMAATKSDWEDQGAQMDYITGKITQLNWYTDETSWNLSDMTDNISKFTSAGIDLDTAVTAMQGIGNWAGSAGAEVSQMSRAMYNLSQAMSMGGVYLRDWMSIENANMATKEFKETAIATGLALGTLEEYADGTIHTLTGVEVTVENFRTTLNTDAGNWFNSDVLVATLEQYGDFSNELYRITEQTGLYATEILGIAKDYEAEQSAYSALAEKLGEESLTKVKGYITDFKNGTLTLDELAEKYGVDAVEIAAAVEDCSSAYIDWVELSEETGVSISELQADIQLLTSDYYALGYEAFKASQEARTFNQAIEATRDAVSTQWSNIFQNVFGNYLESKELWTAFVEDLYDIFVSDLYDINRALVEWGDLGGRDTFIDALWDLWHEGVEVFTAIKDGIQDAFPEISSENLIKFSEDFRDFVDSIALSEDQLNTIRNIVFKFADGIDNIWKAISTIASAVGDAWQRIFPTPTFEDAASAVDTIATNFNYFTASLIPTEEQAAKLERTFAGLFAVLDIVKELFIAILEPIFNLSGDMDGLENGVLDVTASFGDWLVYIRDWIVENDVFRKAVATVVAFIQSIPAKLDQVCRDLFGIGLDEVWNNVKTAAQQAWDTIYNFFVNIPTYAEEASQALFGMSLAELFESIKQAASDAWDAICKFVQEIIAVVQGMFTDIEDSSEDVEDTGKSFSDLIDQIVSGFNTLKETYEKIKPYIDEFLEEMSTSIDFEWLNSEELGDAAVKGGVIAVLVLIINLIIKFVKLITSSTLIQGIVNFGKSITDFFENLSDAAEALKNNIQANTLKTIATAILELAAAIFIIAILDTEKMLAAWAIVTVFLIELAGIMWLFDNLTVDPKKFAQIRKVLTEFMIIIAEVTAAIVIIAQQDFGSIIAAASAIAVLMAEIAAIVIIFGKIPNLDEGQIIKTTGSMILIGAAMLEIAVAISIIAGYNPASLLSSGIALLSLIAVVSLILVAFGSLPDLDEKQIATASASMILAGAAMVEMAIALAIVANSASDWTVLIGAGVALSAMMIVMAAALIAMSESSVFKGAAALTVASVGIIAMAAALSVIAIIPTESLVISLAAIAVALAVLIYAAGPAEAASVGLYAIGAAFALIGTGAVLAGAGLWLVADAIAKLAAVGPEGVQAIVDGILGFMQILPEIIPTIIDTVISLIEAIVDARERILDAVVTMLVGLLERVNTVVPAICETVVTVVLAIVETVHTLIPAVMQLLVELFMAINDYIWITAPEIVATSMMVLGLLFDSAVDFLWKTAPELVALLIMLADQAFYPLMDWLVSITPTLIDTLVYITEEATNALLDLLYEFTPKLTDLLIFVTQDALRGLAQITSDITATAFAILIDILTQIKNNLAELIALSVEIAIELVVGLLEGLAEEMPRMAQAGIDFVLGFIDGISSAITDNAERIRESMENLANALLTAFCTVLGIESPSTVFEENGENIIAGLIEGLFAKLDELLDDITEIADDVISTIEEKLPEFLEKGKELIQKIRDGVFEVNGIILEEVISIILDVVDWLEGKWSDFKDWGSETINKIRDGIENCKNVIRSKVVEIVSDAYNWLKDQWDNWKQVGIDLINGLKKGIEDTASAVVKSVQKLADDVISTATSAFDTHSPSKVFERIGMYNDEGLAKGISDYASVVTDASEDMANDTIDSVADVIANMSNILDGEMDTEPTIRPVLDLTDIMNGTGTIDDLLNSERSMNLASLNGTDMNRDIEERERLSTAIDELKSVLSGFEKNQNGIVNNNTFNVTGNNPREIADEISRILQNQVERRDAAWV